MKAFLLISLGLILFPSILYPQSKELEYENLKLLKENGEIGILNFHEESQDWQWLEDIEPKIDFPFDFESYSFIYLDTFTYDSLSKEVLFERTHEFIIESGANLDNTIKYSNKENGVIMAEGYIDFIFNKEKAGVLGLSYSEVEVNRHLKLNLTFRIRNNGIQIRLIPIGLYDYYYTITDNLVTTETPIQDFYPFTNVKTGAKYGIDKARLNAYYLIKGMHQRVLQFIESINQYYLNTHSQYNIYNR